jgi:hypothetical protein
MYRFYEVNHSMDTHAYVVKYDLLVQKGNYTEKTGYEMNINAFSSNDAQQSLELLFSPNRILIHSIHKTIPIDLSSREVIRRDTIINMGWVQRELDELSDKKLSDKKHSKPVWVNRG